MGRLVKIPKYKIYDFDNESLNKALNDYRDRVKYVTMKNDEELDYVMDPGHLLGELKSFDDDTFTIDLKYNTELFDKMKNPQILLCVLATKNKNGVKTNWEVDTVLKVLVDDINDTEVK